MANSEKKTRPVNEVRSGSVKLAIWRNETKHGTKFSVTAERLYRDQAGNWQSIKSFNEADVSDLIVAGMEAKLWMNAQRDQESGDVRADERAA